MTAPSQELLISTEPLEAGAYRPYGDVVAARADIAPSSANQGTAQRYNHLGVLENLRPGDAAPNLCVFRSSPFRGERFEVKLLERHSHSTQLFVPMTCARNYLVVVCLGQDQPDLGTLKAFLADKDQGITYHPGVWHHPLIALDEVTDFACVVWENGHPEDCETVRLPKGGPDLLVAMARQSRV